MQAGRTIDHVALIAAAGSALVGAWLLLVTRTILPDHDPGMVGSWTVVAIGYLAYAAFTVILIGRGEPSRALRWLAVALSVVALAVGGYLIGSMLAATDGFEGYLLLMGVVLAAHGAVVLVREIAAATGHRVDA